MPVSMRSVFGCLATFAYALASAVASADNAGFALAPKDASLAIDARGVSELVEGERGLLLRPLVEALAGPDALATLDKLAKRANAPGEIVARDVFAGRIAFFLPSAGSAWLLGFESDDARCEHLMKMLGAKLVAPARFESNSERLAMRRVGGWLLMAPSDDAGRAVIDHAARRVPIEDAGTSLLGEPLMQGLLASEAPVRVFIRHGAPVGGASSLSIRPDKRGFHIELSGEYDAPPMGLAPRHEVLDAHLVRAFEDRAVLVLANPADGLPAKADAFWLALLPELVPPPAMRANLSGERVFFVGLSEGRPTPALACAWRVEDADQAEVDQDHFMRGVCCGLTRAVEVPRSDQKRVDADQQADQQTHQQTDGENDSASPARAGDPSAPGHREGAGARVCSDLGPFVNRYLGSAFKLGDSVLCWRTVETPCGGWQVYSSDPRWLSDVSDGLRSSSCATEGRTKAGGLGFCDGARAATLLRRWQPLVSPGGNERIARGLSAISGMLEKLGRIRFHYEMPSPSQVHAAFELEPMGQLTGRPAQPARKSLDSAPGSKQ